MPVLLLTDSRGHGLSQFLDIEAPNVFRVSARSGDTTAGLFKRAVNVAVIIMGGICNITAKDATTNRVYLREYDVDTVKKGGLTPPYALRPSRTRHGMARTNWGKYWMMKRPGSTAKLRKTNHTQRNLTPTRRPMLPRPLEKTPATKKTRRSRPRSGEWQDD